LNSYKIVGGKISLEIAVVDIGKIRLHEETVPNLVERLADEMRRDGVLKNPIIVDKKSLVVLDGMHRVAAAKKIGCRRMPVCLVDYDDRSITVGAWYRTVKNAKSTKQLIPLLNKMKLKFEERESAPMENVFEKDFIAALLIDRKRMLLIHGVEAEVRKSYEIIAAIESEAERSGFQIDYETESDAKNKLEKGEVDVVIATPPVRKEDILRAGVSLNPFPHKATRHRIPSRPLDINIPLTILTNRDTTLEQANNVVLQFLSSRKLSRMPAGSLIENRRYEEEVFLFE